jgi:hypothetical protein
MIPKEIEGLPTDVVETGPFRLSAAQGVPPFPEQDAYKQGDFGRKRPIKGGTQLGAKGGPAMPGTLGFMARVSGDPKRIMAVTCFHAVYPTGVFELNRKCGQPNSEESSTKCCDNKIGLCVAGHYDAQLDGALVRVDGGQEWVAEIHQIGFIKGPHTITADEATSLTYEVRKRGRTLRLTGGTVQSIVGNGTMNDPNMPARPFTNGIIVKPNPSDVSTNPWFQQEGDSGAALVNDNNEVTGILFGRNAQGWGIAEPIQDIIDKFRTDDGITLEVATATKLGQVQTVPAAAADDAGSGLRFLRSAATAARSRSDRRRARAHLHLAGALARVKPSGPSRTASCGDLATRRRTWLFRLVINLWTRRIFRCLGKFAACRRACAR